MSQAKEKCRRQNSNSSLPSIQSREENEILKQNFNSNYWIGLKRSSISSDRWYLMDWERAKFFDWASGQPNGEEKETDEDCVMSGGYGWHDFPCSNKEASAIVCKMEVFDC